MTPTRRHALALGIGAVYLASFVLPVHPAGSWGGLVFLCAFLIGALNGLPALLSAWSANVFFVVGLASVWAGQGRRVTRSGTAALVASLPAIRYEADWIQTAVGTGDGPKLLGASGYFAWMLALIALTITGTAMMRGESPDHPRIEIRLWWGMIMVAAVALILAKWPIAERVLYTGWITGYRL